MPVIQRAQLEAEDEITQRRMEIWNRYHSAFAAIEATGKARRPVIPPDCKHNAHMYYLLLPDLAVRTQFIELLKAQGVHTVFHYIPLDTSPMGRKVARAAGDLAVTREMSERLVRLPLWPGLEDHHDGVIEKIKTAIG